MINQETSGFDSTPITINRHNFECLYNSYWKKVFGIIYRYTEDKEISAELSQELFASIWEKRTTLVIHKDIASYLFRAAKLEAFDYLRTFTRQKQLLESYAHQSSFQMQNSTEDAIMHNELHERLTILVGQLPKRCQEVYCLSQNHGLNNSKIAGMLSISEKTVEYHLYKAMSFIRESLRGEKA